MLFNQTSILFTFLPLILCGILKNSKINDLKIGKYFILLSTLLMSIPIFTLSGEIFGLKVLYLLFLGFQLTEIFLNLKSSINLYTTCLFVMVYFFSLSKNLVYDLSIVSSIIILLFIIFNKEEKEQKFEDSLKIYVNLFILFILFFIFVLCLKLSSNFSSYDKLSIHFPIHYSIGLSFLFFSLFSILFLFPFVCSDKLVNERVFNFKLIFPISVFYYGFLSKFTWMAQVLLLQLPNSFQDYFWEIGGFMFSICFVFWILKFLAKNRGWENKFVSTCFLNLSIALLIPFLGQNNLIVDRFQWLLLSVLVPTIIWSFLNNLNQYYSIPRPLYSFVLWFLFGAPLGAVFFSKALLALPFYKQRLFFEYAVYLGLSQLISFWVISEFFRKDRTFFLKKGKLNPSA